MYRQSFTTRTLGRLIASAALTVALAGCIDDLGGAPIVEGDEALHCAGGLCLGAATIDVMADRAERLETCVAEPDDFARPRDPSGLTVGGITLTERDGVAVLELELLNLDPQGFYAYPGLTLEVLEGAVALPEQGFVDAPAGRHYVDQYYGIAGCDSYRSVVPLVRPEGAEGPITLRASASVLHAEAADEWVFVLAPAEG